MFDTTDMRNAIDLLQHEYDLCIEVNDEELAKALKTVIDYLKDCM